MNSTSQPWGAEFGAQPERTRNRFPNLFAAIEGQLRVVMEDFPQECCRRVYAQYDAALLAHLARATKTSFGIVMLCEHGLGELAMMAVRVLGEIMVSAYWMSLQPDERAEQFALFTDMEQQKVWELTERLGWRDEVQLPDALRDSRHIEELKKRFPNPVRGWTQVGMGKLVSEVAQCWATEEGKKQFRELTAVLRFFGNQQSHVGAYDTAQYLETGDRQVTLQVGPSEHCVPQALFTAVWCYGQIFDLAAEHFKMTHLDRWRAHWQILVARCRELPPEKMNDVLPTDLCPCGSGFTFEECHLGTRCAEGRG